MALIGDLVQKLTGLQRDPAQAIMASAAPQGGDGGGTGAPMVIAAPAGVPTSGAPAAQDGAPQPAPAPAAPAPAAPPDLSTLYERLMKQDRSQRNIDSGMTLMAAGLASPENRGNLISMAAGQGQQPGNAAQALKTLMTLQTNQADLARKQLLRQQLPTIAKQLGIPIEQVQQMFESGKIDDLLKTMNSPEGVKNIVDPATGKTFIYRGGIKVGEVETGLAPHFVENTNGATGEKVVQNANRPGQAPVVLPGALKPDNRTLEDKGTGETVVFDGNTGREAGRIGTTKPPAYQAITDDATGEKFLVDFNNPTAPRLSLGTGKDMNTTDTKNYAAYVNDPNRPKDKPLKDFDTWMTEQNRTKAERTIEKSANTAVATAFAGSYKEDYDVAEGHFATSNQLKQARATLEDPSKDLINGSAAAPYELATRKVFAHALGLKDNAASNTETLRSNMREVVLPKVKTLGTGNSISNADRDYIDQAVGGDITMNRQSMMRITRAMDVASRIEAVDKYNGLKQKMDSDPEFAKVARLPRIPDYDPSLVSHIDPAAIKYLQENPGTRAAFDAKYGEGRKMSKYILGN